MEVAISSPVNIDPPPLFFAPRSPTSSPSQSRSPQHSPQFSSRHYSPPPLPSPSSVRSRPVAMDLHPPIVIAHPEGQNHDRIDAEMGNGGASSGGIASDPVTSTSSREITSEADMEVMDTAPDHPQRGVDGSGENPPQESASGELGTETLGVVTPPPQPNVSVMVGTNTPPPPLESENLVRVTSNGSSIDSGAGMDIVPPVRTGGTARRRTINVPPPPPPPPDSIHDPEGEQDEELQDDEEDPWWADLTEDTSAPNEEELKEIEQGSPEISALDHKHWENEFWPELDDPEYVPGETARIDWTVHNVHGTRQKPNRLTVLRSPPKFIGGFYWRLKLYPRGDQTSSLSVYLECSTESYNDDDMEREDGATDDAEIIRESEDDKLTAAVDMPEGSSDPEVRDPDSSMQDSPSSPNAEDEAPWEVAAQFGVVLYNPAEPRVQYSFKEHHQFWNGNDDFGRKYFHGPWTEIHVRQRGQRQALLRNDTLALTAYIRIVKDPTGSLWWRQRDEGPSWNNIAKTGLSGLSTRMEGEGFFTAGMAAWLHLAPFQDLVYGFHAPLPDEEPFARPKPLFLALQRVLHHALHEVPPNNTVELTPIVQALKWYGVDFRTKIDTLEAWEIIRWKMEQEAEGTETQRKLVELFGPITSPSHHHLNGTSSVETGVHDYPCIRIPARRGGSIQEHLNKALDGGRKLARQVIESAPKLLQVEIERQLFEGTTRKWKKVNTRVVLNQKLEFPQQTVDCGSKLTYSLYGMIVHRGALQSGLYYLVIRPGGPGTKWFKFYGERRGYQVQCVTTKKAIRAHEGFDEGERDEETAAVAYLVMYLRDDVFIDNADERSKLVSRWLKRETQSSLDGPFHTGAPLDQGSAASAEVKPVEVKPEAEQVTFRVFHHDMFKGHQGHGIVDVYDPRWASGLSEVVSHVTVDGETTYEELQRKVLLQMRQTKTSAQNLLFLMDGSVQNAPRLTDRSLDVKMEEVRRDHPLRCLWLVTLPSTHKVESINSSGANDETTPMDVLNPSLEDDSEDVDMEDHPEEVDSSVVPDNGATVDHASITAIDTLEEPTSADPAATVALSPVEKFHASGFTYILLKHYDTERQNLTGLCGVATNRHEKVKDAVEKLLPGLALPKVSDASTWTIWKEVGPDNAKVIESYNTFEDEDLTSGSIIILQQQPSAEETKLIEERGDFANPADYLHYLCLCSNHPNRINGYITQSYFSSNYFSGTMKRGRAYGPCVTTDMNGNSYAGSLVASNRSGLGTMTYQNGDVYEGEWLADQMHGEGKMVYAATGNEYVGGFRKGKRFGKGTMHYLVADEEERTCQICYESEQDALFYDCGHVCACVECARQVEICPVCRRAVRAVVKIYRT